MIAKFNTMGNGGATSGGASSSGKINTLVVLALVGIAGYIAYQYFFKAKPQESPQENQ